MIFRGRCIADAAVRRRRNPAGTNLSVERQDLRVTSRTHAHYKGVQGELPFQYWDKSDLLFADLRTTSGEFATIDYSENPPLLFLGRSGRVRRSASEESARVRGLDLMAAVQAKSISCPNCGGPVQLRGFAHTLSVVCPQCLRCWMPPRPRSRSSRVPRRRARAADDPARHARQNSAGDTQYEVIGFQVRAVSEGDDSYSWNEYLLFNPYKGFRYLTEYNGHWNFVHVESAMPEQSRSARQARDALSAARPIWRSTP